MAGFRAYVNCKEKVTFPWTMIDKITPRPDASVEELLKKDGIEELDPVITSKNTYVAPFVNAYAKNILSSKMHFRTEDQNGKRRPDVYRA